MSNVDKPEFVVRICSASYEITGLPASLPPRLDFGCDVAEPEDVLNKLSSLTIFGMRGRVLISIITMRED
jgi:hypothetical protein